MSLSDCQTREICKDVIAPASSDSKLSQNNKKKLPAGSGCFQIPDPACNPAALTNRAADDALANKFAAEAINLAGADVLVYKMLGIHEQCRLVDVTGNGNPISSGDTPQYSASNAFDKYLSEWRSLQRGGGVVSSAYIGYDFGEIRTPGGKKVYSVTAGIRKHVTAVTIKQSSISNNRVTKARLERSEDGAKWLGVEILELPNDDCLNTIMSKSSAPARFWRLRPILFNGSGPDFWGVQALQLHHNYEATAINNIQDKIFLENRNRDYADDPIYMKGKYDPPDVNTDLAKMGIGFEILSSSYSIQMSFASCVQQLGRPIVIGDVINLPSETQYAPDMTPVLKWLEVTDVTWDTTSYSAAWKPVLYRVTAQPMYASEESQDIFGDLAPTRDENGLLDKDDGNSRVWQDYGDVSQTILAYAKDRVPQRGATVSSAIRKFSDSEIAAAKSQNLSVLEKIGQNETGLYVEDALPPDDASYTEGDSFPTNPTNGDYHRLTYDHLEDPYPARLYRWSVNKGRWIYLETDKRSIYDPTKPVMTEFKKSSTRKKNAKITNDRKDLDEC